MKYHKRSVKLDGIPEILYVFEPPYAMLSDVFAVDVRTNGDAIRASMAEVLDYQYDSSFFSGDVYDFSVYRDVTIVDRIYGSEAPVEVDTGVLYRVIGSFLRDNGVAVEPDIWEEM